MRALQEQVQSNECPPSALCPPTEQTGLQSESILSSPAVQRGFWTCLKNVLKAIGSRKKQTTAQPPKKTAQDWRDEIQAKNPFWGGGF